jgi:hypothetical protein
MNRVTLDSRELEPIKDFFSFWHLTTPKEAMVPSESAPQ